MIQRQEPEKPPADDGRWHIDRKVNISHIVATLLLAAAAFSWASRTEQRIALVEAQNARQNAIDQQQDQEFRRYVVEMREDIRSLAGKIDRLIEKGAAR